MPFQTKTTRPKAVYLWTEADVQKWLRRHCSDYYNLYWERFHEVRIIIDKIFFYIITIDQQFKKKERVSYLEKSAFS